MSVACSRPGRRHLVLVRAGAQSLHVGWQGDSYADRTFDLAVSYFDRAAYDAHQGEEGIAAFFVVGGKWDGIAATLEQIGAALDSYDYVWLPDDDIRADCRTINRLFSEMRRHGMAVGQPALTPQSYFTHFLFIRCEGLSLRLTNYVEIMVPCLALDALQAIRPHFSNTMSGFGLDYTWCRLPQSGKGRCGILDSVAVHHTRPVGSALKGKMARSGVSAKDEERRLNHIFGVTERVTPLAYELRTERNRTLKGLRKAGIVMALLHLRAMITGGAKGRHYGFGRLVQLVKRQFTRRLETSVLSQTGFLDQQCLQEGAAQGTGSA